MEYGLADDLEYQLVRLGDLPDRSARIIRNHLWACSPTVVPVQWPRCVACWAQ